MSSSERAVTLVLAHPKPRQNESALTDLAIEEAFLLLCYAVDIGQDRAFVRVDVVNHRIGGAFQRRDPLPPRPDHGEQELDASYAR